MKRYEARRFRRNDPHSTVRDGVGTHAYHAPDDAVAVDQAKALHAAFYDPAIDQISVREVGSGNEDRLVRIIDRPH